MEYGNPGASTRRCNDRQNQDAHGGCFYTAGGGTAGTAHQHQRIRHRLGGIGHGALGDGIESGRSGGHRLKERCQAFFRHGKISQGSRIIPFQNRNERAAAKGKARGNQQHQTGIYRHLSEGALGEHILPDEKAQAAHGNEQHNGDADHPVAHKGNEAAAHIHSAHNVEAGIAEGRHGVEDAPPQRPVKGNQEAEANGENQRAGAFNNRRTHQHVGHQLDNAAELIHAQALRHEHPLLDADFPVGQQEEHRSDGHKAQAAHLNEQQNHHLSKTAPVGIGIKKRQSRHAGGRGGGKDRREIACPRPGAG